MDIFGIIYKALNKLSKSVTSLRGVIDKKQNKLTYDDGSEITNYQDLFLDIVKEIPIEGTVFLYNKTGVPIICKNEYNANVYYYNTRKIFIFPEPLISFFQNNLNELVAVLSLNCVEKLETKGLFQGHYNLLEVRNITNGDYITDITNMFKECPSLRHIDDYFANNLVIMSGAFSETPKLENLPELNTSKVTDFSHALESSGATEIPKSWTFENAETCSAFAEKSKIKNIDLTFPKRCSLVNAFYQCSRLEYANINAPIVSNFTATFFGCSSLKKVTLVIGASGNYDKPRLNSTFYDCYNLEEIEFAEPAIIYSSSYTFVGCQNLRVIKGDIISEHGFSMTTDFYECYSLEEFNGIIGIKHNLNLSDSSKLTYESLKSIINRIETDEWQEEMVLTLHQEAYDRLTPEDIAVATNKGWSVVSANEY